MTEWSALVYMFSLFGAMFAMTIHNKKNKELATSFNWKNYTRPTPRNVLRMTEFVQGILLTVSTVSVIMDNPAVAIGINIAMVVVNRLVMFFGDIVEEIKTESVTAEFPSGAEVTVTHEKPKDESEG